MKQRIGLLGVIVCLMAGVAAGQEAQPARAELLANVQAIQPGKPFLLGVRIHMEPGWHVYWKHAGQAGIPTEITFELPEGFEVGEVQYPVPIKFVQPGDIIGYGYEGEVLFLTPVTPPAELEKEQVSIKASAEWLVCADICLPGNAELAITLPVSEEASPANTELFETWAERIPVSMNEEGSLITHVTTHSTQEGRNATNTTVFEMVSPLTEIDFYPAGDPGLRIENIQVQTPEDKQVRITYTISPLAGRKQWPAELEGLIVYTGPHGRQGTMITFPTPALPQPDQN